MANFNGGACIARAIRSVLDQTHADLELVVSDDGSTDDSRAIVRDAMARDRRVRLVESQGGCGPAGARNRALAQATGDWVAIVDSDDIIHPERLARLLQSARALGADAVADDLIFFGADPLERHRTLLQALALTAPVEIDAEALVSGRLNGARGLSLGYLKPLIRRAALQDLRYDEGLRIDEDHDLYLRLLLAGARFVLIPDALYLYRRHAGSASHRYSATSLAQMIEAQTARLAALPPDQTGLARAMSRRIRVHRHELHYARLTAALKSGDLSGAALHLVRHPRNALSLARSLRERMRRRRHRPAGPVTPMKLLLCPRGGATPADLRDHHRVEVPEVPATGWLPSAAGTWAQLARLSCEHELDIVAVGRAGQFALGLVPQYRTARVVQMPPGAASTSRSAGPSLCAEGA
jgi:succinoglycan biosynthesis protein ExoO